MSSCGIAILVGTTKGVFLVSGNNERREWIVRGPFCDGWPINHIVGDPATGAPLARRVRLGWEHSDATATNWPGVTAFCPNDGETGQSKRFLKSRYSLSVGDIDLTGKMAKHNVAPIRLSGGSI